MPHAARTGIVPRAPWAGCAFSNVQRTSEFEIRLHEQSKEQQQSILSEEAARR